MNQTYKVGQTYYPKHPVSSSKQVNSAAVNQNQFSKILNEQLKSSDTKELKFSSHAKQRLDSRWIQLDSNAMDKLNSAVDKADKKGVKDSLVLMDDIAFVVNVPNRVVVTTVDEASMKEHIFTNIDGAIIL